MDNDKAQSLWALDALNFCNAGIQTGLGPFISIFYTAVGHWVDESPNKRLMTGVAGLVVAAGALGIILLPSFRLQVAVQLLIGLAVTVFPAAAAAFALGVVEEDQLSNRVARNEGFTHGGNVVFAVIAGAVGTLLALKGIFYIAAVFAAGMAPSAFLIRSNHVNYEAARGGSETSDGEQARRGVKDLLTDKRMVTFTVVVALYYLANASPLPLVGEILAPGQEGSPIGLAGCRGSDRGRDRDGRRCNLGRQGGG